MFFTTSCLLRGLRIRLDCELTHISMPGEKGSQPNRSSSTPLTLLRNFTVSVLLILLGRFWTMYVRLRSSQTTLNVPLIRPIQSVDCITQTFWDILLIASGDWTSPHGTDTVVYYVHSTAGRSIELPLPADCQTHSSSPQCAIARFSFSLPPSATYT